MDPASLADALAAYVQDQVEALVARHLPDLDVPRVFAGHPVGPDVRADLAFTLGHLHGSGLGAVAGLAAPEAIARVLRPIDGPATHTFFSYRVAETLARFGPFEGNPLLAGWSEAERANLAAACDSTAFAKLVDQGVLPRNYAAVLARCELARESLGLLEDASLLERMAAGTAHILGANPRGYLDDANTGIGRYDMYTPDVYLFTEPLAPRLGETWRRGMEASLDLVAAVATRDGSSVTWGRSTGALSACLTVELAALAAGRGLAKDPARWLALAENAFARFGGWLRGGLITAHQHRSPYAYRGPARRLQMTLDALGKLAWAALELRAAPVQLAAGPAAEAFGDRDRWLAFQDDPPLGVWSWRSRGLAFVLPVVGGTRSDYLPAPRNPGLFEVPVDADLPTGVPFAVRHGVRFAAGHRPAAVRKVPGGLEIDYDGFTQSGLMEMGEEAQCLGGRRRVRLRVEGRTLRAEEELAFDEPPHAVALQVAETRGRPLRVDFACPSHHRTSVVDTDGLAEYRSFWAELPRVHQVDVEPARAVRLAWSVTPLLRVASTEHEHHYHRSLYDPLAGQVADAPFPRPAPGSPALAREHLRHVDFFHLHWPEWLWGPDPEAHRRFIETLRAAEVRILWTQHNLVPHRKDDAYRTIYGLWAEAADATLHHSRWGESVARERFRFGARTVHRVIPHGHFGNLLSGDETAQRAETEAELGLSPCAVRIGVIGAPRAEKRTRMLMEAFAAACPHRDWQLLVLSLGPEDVVPDDPRIHAIPYPGFQVPREVFNRRLGTLDALAIPIEGGDYLTTGQFADAVGLGIPAITSDWPFLVETLGDAAIVYGRGRAALERCLAGLDAGRLARAAAASRALQADLDWARVAERLLAVMEEVGTARL